jgi:hypothetical protein
MGWFWHLMFNLYEWMVLISNVCSLPLKKMCTWTIFLRSTGAPHSDKFNQQDININKLHNKSGDFLGKLEKQVTPKGPKHLCLIS